ncbi:MAG TPA: DUF2304 domain-containing protein [Gemmatimonadaceae bacterium]|nr:DUF2304 domain-containing protein [Gemmatimonadaceae bacterium]
MTIGQGIFLVAVLAFAYYATRLRSTRSDRLIYVCLAVAGFLLVLYPGWSTGLAHLVGIGRGVDLIIYLFMVFSLFHYAGNASRAKQLERAMTELIRQGALDTARPDSQVRADADVMRVMSE